MEGVDEHGSEGAGATRSRADVRERLVAYWHERFEFARDMAEWLRPIPSSDWTPEMFREPEARYQAYQARHRTRASLEIMGSVFWDAVERIDPSLIEFVEMTVRGGRATVLTDEGYTWPDMPPRRMRYRLEQEDGTWRIESMARWDEDVRRWARVEL